MQFSISIARESINFSFRKQIATPHSHTFAHQNGERTKNYVEKHTRHLNSNLFQLNKYGLTVWHNWISIATVRLHENCTNRVYIILCHEPSRMRCSKSFLHAGSRFKQISTLALRVFFLHRAIYAKAFSITLDSFIVAEDRYICEEYAWRFRILLLPCRRVHNGSVRTVYIFGALVLRFRTISFLHWRRVAAVAVFIVAIPQYFGTHKVCRM